MEVNRRVDRIWSEIVVSKAFRSSISYSKYWVTNLNLSTLHIINVANRCTLLTLINGVKIIERTIEKNNNGYFGQWGVEERGGG